MDNVLVLVRHGQSEWNERNLFTGWRNPDLTQLGVQEAIKAGKLLKTQDIEFDIAYNQRFEAGTNERCLSSWRTSTRHKSRLSATKL